jgi:PhzF family phenazine biosynthesis protein
VGLEITQVDAFTDTPFAGNPAAVCLLPAPRAEGWMQNVAREMNLSETAFLVRQADGYALRWFTPAVEVALCGHATLASAHVLWEEGHLPPTQQARFHTKSGLLTGDRAGAWIELDFPAKREEPAPAPAGLAEALGAAPKYVGKNQFDYLVEVDSEETVRRLAPNHATLAVLPIRGVIVTSRAASGGYDFVSRFFAPGSGISEDPVRARLTARSAPSGRRAWARAICSPTRLRRAAASSASVSSAIASSSAARPSRSSAVS